MFSLQTHFYRQEDISQGTYEARYAHSTMTFTSQAPHNHKFQRTTKSYTIVYEACSLACVQFTMDTPHPSLPIRKQAQFSHYQETPEVRPPPAIHPPPPRSMQKRRFVSGIKYSSDPRSTQNSQHVCIQTLDRVSPQRQPKISTTKRRKKQIKPGKRKKKDSIFVQRRECGRTPWCSPCTKATCTCPQGRLQVDYTFAELPARRGPSRSSAHSASKAVIISKYSLLLWCVIHILFLAIASLAACWRRCGPAFGHIVSQLQCLSRMITRSNGTAAECPAHSAHRSAHHSAAAAAAADHRHHSAVTETPSPAS